ncbi:response regulator [Phenylobacterium sp. J426]|uniref:response regulator n=1 Tax=Phenylobacterium sp. J426 TaxID=2898439 RepID=UPI002150BEA9|nr:response regulator [Phenylobacterium sp. J426]MCR5873814.1 response regulator [Phenylobacterium sp. J426]
MTISETPIALVVDDNDANRLVLELMLQAAGLRTIGAASGADALARLHEQGFDLVVTDLRMPGIDGLGLLAAIRAMPETRHLPVVATSAALVSSRTDVFLEQGFTAFLAKPMLVADVQACVEALGLARPWAVAA